MKTFYPDWRETPPKEKTYRSILKWGDPTEFKHPNKRLYALMKKTFEMTDEDFQAPRETGDEVVDIEMPIRLNTAQVQFFMDLLGAENVFTDSYKRLQVAYGKTMIDLMRLRKGIAENLPDLVLHPKTKEDIAAIVNYCHTEKIPVYIYGGGSSVTRGVEAVCGGVTLDMRVHMKRVVAFNETNQTITVEAGMSGPDLERTLNNAVKELGAKRAFTCGHFPQSFEYSVVGGWVVTRGAGQNSTYYGNADTLVICQEYVTPIGTIKTAEYPAMATGPDMDQLMIGAEGTFGVLVNVTLKVFRHTPETIRRFSYIFKTWEDGMNAAREIMQSEFGFPSVFRLSDPEETDIALKLYGVEGTVIDRLMDLKGYKSGQRCLFLGFNNGHESFTKNVKKQVHRVCKQYGAMYTTGYVTKNWEHGRFRDPYMREDLQDYGIMTDTLECGVTWANMQSVHEGVRAYCKSRPNTICMTHMSHVYPQGANLYFIFIAKINEIDEYLEYQAGILDHIQAYGASMSHHHGIGKMTAPWLENQIGKPQMEVFRALRNYFDPNHIMNPGGTLGLDLPENKKRVVKNILRP